MRKSRSPRSFKARYFNKNARPARRKQRKKDKHRHVPGLMIN